MTADTTSSLRDLYVEALRRNWSALPDWDLRAAANTILHVRDSELDRLRNLVANYKRQLLDAERDREQLRAGGKVAVNADDLRTCLPFVRWCVEIRPEGWRTDLAENGQAALERISDDLASVHPGAGRG